MEPIKKTFHFLPIFSITKHTNPLSDQAKKTFNSTWNYYYSIKFGWLFWVIGK